MSPAPKVSRPCEKCGGRMFLDYFTESCQDCRKSGATVCPNCYTHYEWECSFGCGHVLHMPRVRRKEDTYRAAN